MRVRALDLNGDMQFGQSQRNFFVNQPEAVGQIVWTRLRLWKGDWFLKPLDGTPYKTKVLGKFTDNTRDPVVRARILTTPGVRGIAAYASSLNRDTRVWAVSAKIDTIYGQVLIAGPH